jgi:hypothetical protein
MYASSLANPFLDGPDGACIPDTPALMTRRAKVWVRGTFPTSSIAGASGTGWIVASPINAFANDAICVWASSPASPTAAINTAIATNTFASNSDFVAADLGVQSIQTRVVSAGLRIRNITSQLNRGGYIAGLHEPGHSSLDASTIASLEAYKETKRFSATVDKDSGEYTVLTYRPVETDDLDFITAFPVPPTNSQFMAFMVQAPDTSGLNPQLYDFEFTVNLEMQGPRAIGKEPSHADPVGYAAVNAMTVFSPVLHSPHQKDPSQVAQGFVQAAASYMSGNMSKPKPPQPAGHTSWWHDLLEIAPGVIGAVASFL